MATSHDIGDGDRDSGIDRTLHGDWDKLFALFRSQAETLTEESARVVFPPPEPAPLPDEPLGAFTQNQRVYSTDWLNIRRTPGYQNKLGDDILGLVAPAQPALITGAAVEQDGLTWWPVRLTLDSGLLVDGWAAEANATMRLLSAQEVRPRGAAGVAARQRGRGARRGQARSASELLYTTTYVNLRRTPGYVGKSADDLLGQIPYGAQLMLTGEAVEADALRWRPVRAP
jgi:hypothetical protein